MMEMERDGIGDVEKDVSYLTDYELRQRLLNFGANIGPVTGMSYCPIVPSLKHLFVVLYFMLD